MAVVRTPDDRRQALRRGQLAEQLAADALLADGWTVVARNWRGVGVEIDVIAERGGAVRFVEVKARDARDPAPEDAVSADQQRRLARGAEAWLADRPRIAEASFSVVFVVFDADGVPELTWLDDAFDG